MGWTTERIFKEKLTAKEKKEHIERYFDTNHYEVVKSSVVGNVYYAAIKTKRTGDIWAYVVLTMNRPYEFGTKPMDESMCPCYYDCPKGILDLLTPTDNEYANEWRKECRKKANEKGWEKKIALGETIKYKAYDGEIITLIKHPPAYQFKTWFWYCPDKGVYIKKNRVKYDDVIFE